MSDGVCEHTAPAGSGLPMDSAAAGIIEGFDLLVEEMHPLVKVIQVFRDLLVERARIKAELEGFQPVSIERPDPERFERGVPLSSIENLIDGIDDPFWTGSAKRLIPIMVSSFPKVSGDLEIIGSLLAQGRLNPREVLKSSISGDEGKNVEVASRLQVDPQTLAFALGQIAKPLIERISSNLAGLVENLSWRKGYCPICGTMPELAFLQGEGGQRWLRCASCAHEWRFVRLVCPFCENDCQEDFQFYSVAGRDYESVDVCGKCGRYVPTIDLRNRPKAVAKEIAVMAMMHLDVIAQEKGFLPVAACAWNIVRDRDVFSMPIRV